MWVWLESFGEEVSSRIGDRQVEALMGIVAERVYLVLLFCECGAKVGLDETIRDVTHNSVCNNKGIPLPMVTSCLTVIIMRFTKMGMQGAVCFLCHWTTGRIFSTPYGRLSSKVSYGGQTFYFYVLP